MTQSEVSTKAKLAILSAGLLSFIGILIETSMNVTFPALIASMHVSLDTVQWLTTGYLLFTTIVMSTTAFVLKRFAPKAIFIVAASVCFVGGVLCLIAPTFWILFLGRLLQAVATGLSTPLMFQIIFTNVPIRKLGVYTGLASVIISLAPALGPTYGGILSSIWSWRALFVGILPFIVLVMFLGIYAIHGKPSGTGGRTFDVVGVLLLAAVFTVLLFTFTEGGTHGWLSLTFWLWMFATALLIAAFVLYIHKGTRKLFDYSILKNPVLRLRLFHYFGLQFINIGLSFVLPLFAQTVLGASAMTAGLMILPGALVGAATAPIAGRYYDIHGPSRPLIFSAIMASLALLLFYVFTDNFTVVVIGAIYVVLRIGFNSGFGTAISDGSTQVEPSQKADQNSMFSMMQQYAGSLGTSVMSAIVSSFGLYEGSRAAMVSGSKVDFIVLFVLALGILASAIYTHVRHTRVTETAEATPSPAPSNPVQ
ncbi:MAG: MFS transporter [Bifidobacteriaceae bacterium]|nr:MFS transporter [Bifidobacteriaceae bacterium]